MEGHSVENGGYCDSEAEYEANAVVQLDHFGMSQEYISTFKPTSYAKTWIRYVPMIYEESEIFVKKNQNMIESKILIV